MTNPGSKDTHLQSHPNGTKVTVAEGEDIQQWIDHGSPDPQGAPRDAQLCWDLLRSSDALSTSGESIFEAEKSPTVDRPDKAALGSSVAGRFAPKQTMGIGGFGVVLHVYDHQLQRPVALKILRPSLGKPLQLVNRFIREARAVASLEHPGIVRVFETGSISGHPFIAIELVAGPTLSRFVRNQPTRLPVRQTVWLMQQVADAVQFAHSRGVLHRDLKPGNILLTEVPPETSEGLGFAPRLTDFGLAKRIATGDTLEENLTLETQVLGTVRYMSPEQASGRLADVAIASDVFSLGVILYELLTGQVPFAAPSDSGILHRICHDQPARPRKLMPGLPRDLEAIVLKALAKEPAQRYVSAGAMREDLARFLRGAPIEADRFSYPRQITYWVRMRPGTAAAIALAAVGMLAATTLVTTAWLSERKANRQAELARKESEESRRLSLDSINSFFFHLIEKLNEGKPISDEERVKLLRDALEFHHKYEQQYPNDRQSLHRLSIAYHHLGNALVQQGEWEQAIQAKQETMRLLEILLRTDPNHKKLLFQLSLAHCNITFPLVWATGNKEAAKEHAAQALSIIDKLLALYPEDAAYADAANHYRLTSYDFEPDVGRAQQLLLTTIENSTSLWKNDAGNPQLAKHAVYASSRLAASYLTQHKLTQAYQESQRTVGLFDQAFAGVKGQAWVKVIERAALRVHVNVLLRCERWEELRAAAIRGAELERQTDLSSELRSSQYYEIYHLGMQCVALRKMERTPEAEIVFKQAQERIDAVELSKGHAEELETLFMPFGLKFDTGSQELGRP